VRLAVADQAAVDLTMPRVVIDGVTIRAARLMLSPAEVARVLRVEEKDVRNMIRRGELRDVSSDSKRRLDPNEVIALVEQRVGDGELGRHVYVELAASISGHL
jgi:excisionase family DNA binding protein